VSVIFGRLWTKHCETSTWQFKYRKTSNTRPRFY